MVRFWSRFILYVTYVAFGPRNIFLGGPLPLEYSPKSVIDIPFFLLVASGICGCGCTVPKSEVTEAVK